MQRVHDVGRSSASSRRRTAGVGGRKQADDGSYMFRPSDLPVLRVDLSRGVGAVIDMAAHRGTRKGAADRGVTTSAVDEIAQDSVSRHSS
jgi:hypothetical protein